jgi:dihydrodipicolinate synthase/N-acetylneuraminate lyase
MTGNSLSGVIPILQTPFRTDGSIDLDSLAAVVAHIHDAGARAFAYPAFASEWWKLSDAEQLAACQVLVDAKPPGCTSILGVNSQSTYGAVATARQLQQLGADALICLPPFVVAQDGVRTVEHCADVVAAVDIPVILQYSPNLVGSSFDLPSLQELHATHPNFNGVKVDMVPTGPAVSSLAHAFADSIADGGMKLLIGYAGIQLPDAVTRGATGLMGGAGHVAHDITMFNTITSAHDNSWLPAFRTLLPLLNFEMQSIEITIAAHKHMLWRKGVIATSLVRAPGKQLDEFHEQELTLLLDSLET